MTRNLYYFRIDAMVIWHTFKKKPTDAFNSPYAYQFVPRVKDITIKLVPYISLKQLDVSALFHVPELVVYIVTVSSEHGVTTTF